MNDKMERLTEVGIAQAASALNSEDQQAAETAMVILLGDALINLKTIADGITKLSNFKLEKIGEIIFAGAKDEAYAAGLETLTDEERQTIEALRRGDLKVVEVPHYAPPPVKSHELDWQVIGATERQPEIEAYIYVDIFDDRINAVKFCIPANEVDWSNNDVANRIVVTHWRRHSFPWVEWGEGTRFPNPEEYGKATVDVKRRNKTVATKVPISTLDMPVPTGRPTPGDVIAWRYNND